MMLLLSYLKEHKIYSEKCFAAEFLNLSRIYYDTFFANVK